MSTVSTSSARGCLHIRVHCAHSAHTHGGSAQRIGEYRMCPRPSARSTHQHFHGGAGVFMRAQGAHLSRVMNLARSPDPGELVGLARLGCWGS
jgi:hypothetical protein